MSVETGHRLAVSLVPRWQSDVLPTIDHAAQRSSLWCGTSRLARRRNSIASPKPAIYASGRLFRLTGGNWPLKFPSRERQDHPGHAGGGRRSARAAARRQSPFPRGWPGRPMAGACSSSRGPAPMSRKTGCGRSRSRAANHENWGSRRKIYAVSPSIRTGGISLSPPRGQIRSLGDGELSAGRQSGEQMSQGGQAAWASARRRHRSVSPGAPRILTRSDTS